jgi:uncharacterized repeat protein (TIGR03833 family)
MEYLGNRRRRQRRQRRQRSNTPPPPAPRVGDTVQIILKPYDNNVKVIGVVKRVLTKRKYHSRGHKVELKNGTIGRTVKIIKRK